MVKNKKINVFGIELSATALIIIFVLGFLAFGGRQCIFPEQQAIISEEGVTERVIEKTVIIEKEVPAVEEVPAEEVPFCSNPDGEDPWTAQSCTDEISGYLDHCMMDYQSSLNEMICDQGRCVIKIIQCDTLKAFCRAGKCVSNYVDTDGDGYTDIGEYDEGKDPFSAWSHPYWTTSSCAMYASTKYGGSRIGLVQPGGTCEALATEFCSTYASTYGWTGIVDWWDWYNNCCMFNCK